MAVDEELRQLQALARMYGVQPTFVDVEDRLQVASVDALRAVLATLGQPADGSTDIQRARRERKRWFLEQPLEPVSVLHETGDHVVVRLPPGANDAKLACTLRLEDGGEEAWTVRADTLPVLRRDTLAGRTAAKDAFASLRLACPRPVPFGYHDLRVEVGGKRYETLVIKAPQGIWAPPGADRRVEWGVFLPMYATHGERSWGCGDFSDYEQLLDWIGQRGGHFVGTLPLLATEWELDLDPSPYAPTSRRFWNEFFLDPRRCAEFSRCEEARRLVASPEFRAVVDEAKLARLVDWNRLVPLKRQVVELLAETFFASNRDRRNELQAWLVENPEAERFARFRAMGEARGGRWPTWSEFPGDAEETLDLDTDAYRYHVYAQWQTRLQLGELARSGRSAELYLDFPLGTRRDGYDVWCEPEAFALAASGGAPPDAFFTLGQDWGFPPLHNQGIRVARYRPWIEGLRAHLRLARLLRIDHAMGLHRLYWVPIGATPRDGVYVRYATEELFAILALESHRHRAILVGENLGTCPPAVDRAMAEHALSGMYVLEFEIDVEEEPPLHPVPSDALASLNTHDLPTFSSFWNGLDVDDHLDLGLLDEAGAETSRDNRAAMRHAVAAHLAEAGFLDPDTIDEQAILTACLEWLVAQGPRYVIVNLEDAWSETQPQNHPGTWRERPNWRLRSRLSLEEIEADDRVRELLATLEAAASRAGE